MDTSSSIISCLKKSELGKLISELKKMEYFILLIDGSDIKDAKAFFSKVKNELPFDPPITGSIHYDAFSDSLWEGIVNLKKEKVAIVWTKSDNMLSHGLLDLLNISQTFLDVARELYGMNPEISHPIILKIFLMGTGENYGCFHLS